MSSRKTSPFLAAIAARIARPNFPLDLAELDITPLRAAIGRTSRDLRLCRNEFCLAILEDSEFGLISLLQNSSSSSEERSAVLAFLGNTSVALRSGAIVFDAENYRSIMRSIVRQYDYLRIACPVHEALSPIEFCLHAGYFMAGEETADGELVFNSAAYAAQRLSEGEIAMDGYRQFCFEKVEECLIEPLRVMEMAL